MTATAELGQLRTHALQQIALHSITSSARASSGNGTVNPSAFAVLRLITISYMVGFLHRQIPGVGLVGERPNEEEVAVQRNCQDAREDDKIIRSVRGAQN